MEGAAHVQLPDSAACTAAIAVVTQLRAAGWSAYLVGGCVRDLVLGLAPKDYDVATDAKPHDIRGIFGHVIEVGIAFGVVRVRQRDAGGEWHEMEVATFRADGEYYDGRRPADVRFTDAREDVLRRDFTLNGLLLDPLAGPSQGLVVDWVGGLADLHRGILRAIGVPEQRFAEDALRLLRAVRFAARFGLAIDEATQAAIRAAAVTLRRVSVERTTAELAAMLTAPTAVSAVRWLAELGLGEVLWPTLAASDPGLVRTRQRFTFALRELDADLVVFEHALPVLRELSLPLALALLADGDQKWLGGEEASRSLRLSNQERGETMRTVALMRDVDLGSPRARPWSAGETRWLRDAHADAALVAIAARQPDEGRWRHWRQIRGQTDGQAVFPALPVTGSMLQQWGFLPGPGFKLAIAAAEDCYLETGDARAAEAAARRVLQQVE